MKYENNNIELLHNIIKFRIIIIIVQSENFHKMARIGPTANIIINK